MSQTAHARPRSKLLTKAFLMAFVAIAVLAAVLSYTWFIDPATESVETVGPADAVVVFAGSGERIETAIELMERGVAPNLVIPNGRSDEIDDEDLCDETASFQVFCPGSATIDTEGEAQTIGRLAEERGWSNLIAVTSSYHVHRATYQLGLCHDGAIQAVSSNRLDRDDLVNSLIHEWAGTIAAMTIQRAC